MKTFVIDIETMPNPELVDLCAGRIEPSKVLKDPEKIELDILKKKQGLVKTMSVDVDYSVVKCIGFKEDDEPARIISLEELINNLYDQVKMQPEGQENFITRHFFRVVTFNGKKFDLPILIRECIRKNVGRNVVPFLKQWSKRYDSAYHVDLFELLGDGDGKSLDLYSQIYLNWPKKEIDFETCTDEELEKHCVDDVEMTSALFKKFEWLLNIDYNNIR